MAGLGVAGAGVDMVRVEGAVGDLVEAEGGGGHVLVQAVQSRVQRGALRMPHLHVAAGTVAMLTASALSSLRVAGQCGCRTERKER